MTVTNDRTGKDLSFGPIFTAALWLSLIFSAYFMAVAAASSEHGWLAWISLAPLFIAIWSLPLGRAAISGAIWGTSLYLFSMAVGNPAFSTSFSSFFLLVTISTAYVFLGTLFTRRFGFSPLALALGWICVELALQPMGMQHGLLAASQVGDGLPRLIANFLGYGFVAFLVSFVNALLLWIAGAVACVVTPAHLLIRVTDSAAFIAPLEPSYISAFYLQPSRPRAPPV